MATAVAGEEVLVDTRGHLDRELDEVRRQLDHVGQGGDPRSGTVDRGAEPEPSQARVPGHGGFRLVGVAALGGRV